MKKEVVLRCADCNRMLDKQKIEENEIKNICTYAVCKVCMDKRLKGGKR